MGAAKEIELIWLCWFLYFRWLHKERPRLEPAAVADYHAKEAVYYHKLMLRPWRWWSPFV